MDLEEAIKICEKNFLSVYFQLDLNKKNYNYVTVAPNAWCTYTGDTLIEAVEKYVREHKKNK